METTLARIRSLLYPVDPTVDIKGNWVEAAVSAAKCFNAYLEVLHVQISPTVVIGPGTYGITAEAMRGISAAAERHMSESVEQVRERLGEIASRLGVPIVGGPGEAGEGASVALVAGKQGLRSAVVSLRGRVADMVLVRQPSVETLTSATFEAALKETGRPVLVLPKGVTEVGARRVGIAWNGRMEVARAVGASLGLLASADEVHVLSSRKRSQSAPSPEQLADYLGLHGIKVTLNNLEVDGPIVAEALLEQIGMLDLDLMIAGAYSRSRLRDVIFGSVTQRILTGSPIPLVVSH